MQTAATWGVAGSPGSGAIALAHIDRTLPSVSAPSSVVRSIMLMAVSMAQACEVVLMERVPNPAARESAPTWSTLGSPCSHLVNEALVRAPTPSNSRASEVAVRVRALAGGELTVGVYRPMLSSRGAADRNGRSRWDRLACNEIGQSARTWLSNKISTRQQLIRQRSPLGLAAVCGVIGLVLLVSMAWQWAEYPEPLFAAWVVFFMAFVWSLFIRPAVVLDYDGVTIRNIVRDVRIPWSQVGDVECRWSLKVFVGDQPYTAWAISSQAGRPKGGSRGMFAMMPGRLDKLANADAQPSRSAPKVTASLVARSIEQAREEYAEAVAQGLVAAAPEAQVRITWVPMVLAIVLLPAIAVLALSLA